tara:strand:+ start:589 stop:999 length:411 start_codon:yes stop_codon:yes gene_type:complete
MLRNKTANSTQSNMEQKNNIILGTEITGDIKSDSLLFIQGHVKGNISCSSTVIIGETGKITGDVICIDAEIEGSVEGTILVENLLSLKSTSNIIGNIETVRLSIEEGAQFDGACKMKRIEENESPKFIEETIDELD